MKKLTAIVLVLLMLPWPVAAQIPVNRVHVLASPPEVLNWPITTQIREIEVEQRGVRVDFDKANTWPQVTPDGWKGPLRYTLWLMLKIGDEWYASGVIQYWTGGQYNGGPIWLDNQVARNWLYDSRWGPMQGHQPGPGERVGFMVSAGDERSNDKHMVAERSGIIEVAFPSGPVTYGAASFLWQESIAPPVVTPPPPVVVNPPPPAPPVVQPPLPSTDLTPIMNQLAALAQQQATALAQLEQVRADIATVKDVATGVWKEILKYAIPAIGGIVAGWQAGK